MADPYITSTSNPAVRRIRGLRSKRKRDAEGAFFAEGIHVVGQAVEHAADIESLVVAPDLLDSSFGRDLVDGVTGDRVRVIRVSADVYRAIADRDNPSGLGAVVRTSLSELADLRLGGDDIVAAVVGAANPGNLGSIVRTADAVGAAAVVLVGGGTDPWHPTAAKASMGALFTVRIAAASSSEDVLDWARGEGASVVSTSAHASARYDESDYPLPAVVLLGSEATGLPEELRARADIDVAIPMSGAVTSLNLAVAAGILLYEVRRRTTRR